jgi:tyrosyl-tRNA synthetase
MVGDPSGRTVERDAMSTEKISRNAAMIRENVEKIFRNHEELIWPENHLNKQQQQHPQSASSKLPQVKILNNADWYKDIRLIDFMAAYGRNFRMGELLSRKQ